MTSKKESPFLILSNVRGNMEFSYAGLPQPIALTPLKTLLVAHPAGQAQSLRIQGQEATMLLLVNLERKLYIHHIECLPETVQREVSQLFSGQTAIKFFMNSQYGLEGAAIGQQLAEDSKQGLVHATFIEAKVLELFSLQLRRWENEINGKSPQKLALRPGDVENIILARNFLIENIRQAPTIEELSKKAGVNRQKLKQGFKIVFGKTVNEYLRGERLKMARQLLAASQYSVKEISSMVGYENASYFARRFKMAYGLYPNEYAAAAFDHGEEE
jgi:AraC-like DNA-binding protein